MNAMSGNAKPINELKTRYYIRRSTGTINELIFS
jgi:hypothetical protein